MQFTAMIHKSQCETLTPEQFKEEYCFADIEPPKAGEVAFFPAAFNSEQEGSAMVINLEGQLLRIRHDPAAEPSKRHYLTMDIGRDNHAD